MYRIVWQDLDEQRQMNKQAAHDRMVAVARAKDQIKHEMLQEMDRVRAKLKEVGDFISTNS